MTVVRHYFLDDKPNVYLTSYVALVSKELPAHEKRKAILIIPGGGYSFVSDREGEPIAYEFLNRGYNCFVLTYSVGENCVFPSPLIEASLAMKYIKDNAEKFYIDKDDVSVIGFSAGGHMACLLGTMWNSHYVYDNIKIEPGYNKPKAMILCYPVITSGPDTHKGTIETILKDNINDKKYLELVSLEKQVSSETCPCYIWHTAFDTTVPITNSLSFATALSKFKIPYELHIFKDGGHGASTCKPSVRADWPYNTRWIDEAIHFIDNIK